MSEDNMGTRKTKTQPCDLARSVYSSVTEVLADDSNAHSTNSSISNNNNNNSNDRQDRSDKETRFVGGLDCVDRISLGSKIRHGKSACSRQPTTLRRVLACG